MVLKLPRGRLSLSLSQYSDLLLAGLVVGIVGMMIIPLPTFLLDILISTNISISVILLLVGIYVPSALRIATFPSILLITTLFRLGLNVSSTRLILLQANAGQVIQSFGNFVVAGNLVVGAVIFLILTLIQFVVIAKGSERVAEVAARFTLDAMPGKQMAIDADVRAGAIEMDEARRLRGLLQRESQLYGSMDGAMKFVKGDAIAGILITIINIVGGLTIGVLQRSMTLAEAGRVYSLLTIGDGLVSQIPALLISTAAGIVVTRVASEDEGAHLGRDIGGQILAQPRAIAISAGLMALLAIVPGLPTLPFLVLAAVVGGVAYTLRRRTREGSAGPRDAAGVPLADAATDGEHFAPSSAVALAVGPALLPLVDTDGEGRRLVEELIPGLRRMLHGELGIPLPGVHVRAAADDLPAAGYQILLGEIPVATGEVDLARRLVLATEERLAANGVVPAEPSAAPGVGGPAYLLPQAQATQLAAQGFQIVDLQTQIVLHLSEIIRLNVEEFVGIQETQQLLDVLERTHPTLVHEVVPKLISVQTLSEILRRLAREGVSIRPLREILESMAEWALTEKDPAVLAEHARGALKRHISFRFAMGGRLRAYLLDPEIEQVLRESVQRTAKGTYLALEPQLSRDIVEAVRSEVERSEGAGVPTAILTNVEVRRYLRRLLELEFADLPVLAFTELLPTIAVQPVARIGLGGS